jgi:hypothetical protein
MDDTRSHVGQQNYRTTVAVSIMRDGDRISVDANVLCVEHAARWEGFGKEHPHIIAVLKKQDGSFMGMAWKVEEHVALVRRAPGVDAGALRACSSRVTVKRRTRSAPACLGYEFV